MEPLLQSRSTQIRHILPSVAKKVNNFEKHNSALEEDKSAVESVNSYCEQNSVHGYLLQRAAPA